jgi:hypothetical protein
VRTPHPHGLTARETMRRRQLEAVDVIAHVATAPTNTVILARRSAADQAHVLRRSPVGRAEPPAPMRRQQGRRISSSNPFGREQRRRKQPSAQTRQRRLGLAQAPRLRRLPPSPQAPAPPAMAIARSLSNTSPLAEQRSHHAGVAPEGVEEPHSGAARDGRRRPAFVVVRASRRRLHGPCSARKGDARTSSARSPTTRRNGLDGSNDSVGNRSLREAGLRRPGFSFPRTQQSRVRRRVAPSEPSARCRRGACNVSNAMVTRPVRWPLLGLRERGRGRRGTSRRYGAVFLMLAGWLVIVAIVASVMGSV